MDIEDFRLLERLKRSMPNNRDVLRACELGLSQDRELNELKALVAQLKAATQIATSAPDWNDCPNCKRVREQTAERVRRKRRAAKKPT